MKALLLNVVVISTLMVNSIQSFDSEDCKSLGFNKAILMCSTCKHFKKTHPDANDSLEKIWNNCNKCCLKDDDISDTKKYARASLEVCTCKFNAYPQIQAFVKNRPQKKYRNLDIKYVQGMDPILKLYDSKGLLVDHLDIHKWDTDTVDEFLDTHLVK